MAFLVTQGVEPNATSVQVETSSDQDKTIFTQTPPIETNTVNTIEILQNQLNQILVQFCASEIDRNKTASAVLKFGQLANPEASIGNVVQFYIENYEDSFDNLLHFINHVASLDIQQIAYNTLIEAIELNQINVINLLSFENFIRTKVELLDVHHGIERKTYEDLLVKVQDHIKVLIVATDLNKLILFINDSPRPDRIFELIPTIVKGIDLNNFNDMNRIFEFSMQLPTVNQIKLISKVLSEMRYSNRYKHVLHVIIQIRKLRASIDDGSNSREWTAEMKCLLVQLEAQIPSELQELLSAESRWQITFNNSVNFESRYLYYSESAKYSKNLLLLRSNKIYNGWSLFQNSYNSVWIVNNSYGQYISVQYCFHNDSFPTTQLRDESSHTQNNWYLLMSDDLSYFQIKNIFTNQLLVVEDIEEFGNARVALSAQVLDSEIDTTKYSLELESGNYRKLDSNCLNLRRNGY